MMHVCGTFAQGHESGALRRRLAAGHKPGRRTLDGGSMVAKAVLHLAAGTHRTASPVEEVGRNGEKQTAAHSLLAGVTELQDVMTESRSFDIDLAQYSGRQRVKLAEDEAELRAEDGHRVDADNDN
ncbi:hypothetical protein CPLU01_11331 [Colletotrichum plurivorum]|uniref:Uncharacterized protein n=1 Tax=Colletotrichum plurivorum TaxID=2175906 RepID=A0A8H6K368_9PEZI|nr:hypothetical protein CPLU01_11331 [Colletotrichum plurivorum]